MTTPSSTSSQVPLIAGACGCGSWPPNNAKAAGFAVATPGVDGVEIDVHLTADGEIVTHHDYRLRSDSARLAGQWIEEPGPKIRDLTLEQLRAYDLGRAKPGSKAATDYPFREQWDGSALSTLDEVIDVLAAAPGPRPSRLYVEIKTDPTQPEESSDPDRLTRAVIARLAAKGWTAHSKIIAFDWSVLRQVALLAPGLDTAHLVVPKVLEPQVRRDAQGHSPWNDGHDPLLHDGSLGRAAAAHGARQLSIYFKDIDADVVADARAAGLTVAAWGLTEAADIRAMLALGVSSVTALGPYWGRG
ncbi:glycerophosphodiester phosphodiesterase family protein [uncultured Caulobacter sp.]|uniref:glycerophosphodiester phosphodiesterase family protein n=1 Tax=uncultured Caulobacter sp. TaxID=158749 RepID=UPI00260418B7|nr:glycerophosphodiester phosphodiesterase family protein [uncultured Caulobacter sp.]